MSAMRRRLLVPLAALALLAFAAGALAATAPTVTYRGRTDGRSLVTVKVRAGRVTSFKANVYASCGSTNLLIAIVYPPSGARRGTSAPIRDHAFRVSYRSDPTLDPEDDRRTLTGRFASGRLTGAIRVRGLCSADATYAARRVVPQASRR
jgi:hypothetical protein